MLKYPEAKSMKIQQAEGIKNAPVSTFPLYAERWKWFIMIISAVILQLSGTKNCLCQSRLHTARTPHNIRCIEQRWCAHAARVAHFYNLKI
jgi:hypothetical protein